MSERFKGPEEEVPTEEKGKEEIELSSENARAVMNDRMRRVFGNDGDEINKDKPVNVVE